MVELLGPEGVNFFGKRGVNAADPLHDKDVVNLRSLRYWLDIYSASTGGGKTGTVSISTLGNGFPVFAGRTGVTYYFRSLSAGTNLGISTGNVITYYLQPNISVSGLTASTVQVTTLSGNCNNIVTVDCYGNLTTSANTTTLYTNLSAGTATEIISGTNVITIRHNIWESGRTSQNGTYSTYPMAVQLQKGNNISDGYFSLVAGKYNTIKAASGSKYNTILNGSGNTIDVDKKFNTILNGFKNNIIDLGEYNLILGGKNNSIYYSYHTLVGLGSENYIYAGGQDYSILLNGYQITALTQGQTFVGTGFKNYLNSSSYNILLNGKQNIITGTSFNATDFATLINGNQNKIINRGNSYYNLTKYTSIINGRGNILDSSQFSQILNGYYNQILGYNNYLSFNNFSTILNGVNNIIYSGSVFSNVGNGKNNVLSGTPYSVVSNGYNNSGFSSSHLSLVTGKNNYIKNSNFSSIINGYNNSILNGTSGNSYSTIINGLNNSILRSGSTITGGKNITISLSADTTAVPYLRIANIYQGPSTPFQFLTIDNNGYVFKTGITIGGGGGLTFNNLGNAGSPDGNIYSNQNLGVVYLRSLSGGNNIQVIRSTDNNYVTINFTGSTIPALSAGTSIEVITGLTATTIRHTIWESGKTSTGAYAVATMAAQLQKGDNQASSNFALVAGKSNSGLSQYSTIIGGYQNLIKSGSKYSFIGSGIKNTGSSNWSTIINGSGNTASGLRSFIGNGIENSAKTVTSIIINGRANLADGFRASIINGQYNVADGELSIINQGIYNNTNSKYSSIINGSGNTATQFLFPTIVNGRDNRASGKHSFIGNGYNNYVDKVYSTILNGNSNSAITQYSSILNGFSNTGNSKFSSILGGYKNHTLANYYTNKGFGFIGNGSGNTASDNFATIVNGRNNVISRIYTYSFGFIGNGSQNLIQKYNNNSQYGSILNGSGNTVKGAFNTIINGRSNSAFTSNIAFGWSFIGNGQNNFSNYGRFNFFGTGKFNTAINGFYTTILNGEYNYIGNNKAKSSIFNGSGNTIKTYYSTIDNGRNNLIINGNYSSIINGSGNTASTSYSLVLNGQHNIVYGSGSYDFNTIINGKHNRASRYYSLIGGGRFNTANSIFSTIINGSGNTVRFGGRYNLIGNGRGNYVKSTINKSTILNGYDNYISPINTGYLNSIVGGSANTIGTRTGLASNSFSNGHVILGGRNNQIADYNSSTILNGINNLISLNNGGYNLIGGGKQNTIYHARLTNNLGFNTVLAGWLNRVGFSNATPFGVAYDTKFSQVINGYINTARTLFTTIVNGRSNLVGKNRYVLDSVYSGIFAGSGNTVYGNQSFIGNGKSNLISGSTSAILNGFTNDVYSNYSSVINGKINRVIKNNAFNSTYSGIFNGSGNTVFGDLSLIGNGRSNLISGATSLIGNGQDNNIYSSYSAIINGSGNTIYLRNINSSIVGGLSNYISGQSVSNLFAFIGQGRLNRIIPSRGAGYSFPSSTYHPIYSTILNGRENTNKARYSSILNGKSNYIESRGNNSFMPLTGFTTIVNGYFNTALTRHTFIGTGNRNYAGIRAGTNVSKYVVIVNGDRNASQRRFGTIINGNRNNSTSYYSTIINGEYNTASGIKSFIAQGSGNTASGSYSALINGKNNTASGTGSFIGNGSGNTATNTYSSTINGKGNKNSGIGALIGGGVYHTVSGQYSAVVTGDKNTTVGIRSAILNGSGNTINSGALNSAIVGGINNKIDSSVTNAVILGSTGLSLTNPSSSSTGSDSDHTYVDYLKIKTTPDGGTKLLTIDGNGYVYSKVSDNGLIAANSGYINNPSIGRYYIGNNTDGGWNGIPWDFQISGPAPITLLTNSDYNCGVPIIKNLSNLYKIKVCGMAYSRALVGVSANLTVQLSYLLCSDFASSTLLTKIIADNEASPAAFNSSSGHVCFDVSATVPTDLPACETFLYVGFQVDRSLGGDNLEFSYTISYEPA